MDGFLQCNRRSLISGIYDGTTCSTALQSSKSGVGVDNCKGKTRRPRDHGCLRCPIMQGARLGAGGAVERSGQDVALGFPRLCPCDCRARESGAPPLVLARALLLLVVTREGTLVQKRGPSQVPGSDERSVKSVSPWNRPATGDFHRSNVLGRGLLRPRSSKEESASEVSEVRRPPPTPRRTTQRSHPWCLGKPQVKLFGPAL